MVLHVQDPVALQPGPRARAAEDPAEALLGRVQELQVALDRAPESALRGVAEELVGAVVGLYGGGLERIMATVAAGPAGIELTEALSADPLVAALLFIHDLHPVPLEERVQAALDSVRPYMASHGGDVELLGVQDGVAHIHLRGSCSDCSASAVTLELAIKEALDSFAPDLEGLEVEGVAPLTVGGPGLPMLTGARPAGIELPMVMAGPAGGPVDGAPARPRPAAWAELTAAQQPAPGGLLGTRIGDVELLVANVEGTLLAYRDVCAGCWAEIHGGRLSDGALTCPHCQRAYLLTRAGRSLGDENLQLEPVPLLIEAGCVRVALPR
jgi:Fe-S cluster biogenesis protein NfuA/nitrite reductase/ring-hydroxylating ferredoxin subunit